MQLTLQNFGRRQWRFRLARSSRSFAAAHRSGAFTAYARHLALDNFPEIAAQLPLAWALKLAGRGCSPRTFGSTTAVVESGEFILFLLRKHFITENFQKKDPAISFSS
jgi:hypothetical protein